MKFRYRVAIGALIGAVGGRCLLTFEPDLEAQFEALYRPPLDRFLDRNIRFRKSELFGTLSGDVLEIHGGSGRFPFRVRLHRRWSHCPSLFLAPPPHLISFSHTLSLFHRPGVNARHVPRTVGSYTIVEKNRHLKPVIEDAASAAGFPAVRVVAADPATFLRTLPAGSFHAVIAADALAGAADSGPLLDEVKRVLKPGGKFVFADRTPAEAGPFRLLHAAAAAVLPAAIWPSQPVLPALRERFEFVYAEDWSSPVRDRGAPRADVPVLDAPPLYRGEVLRPDDGYITTRPRTVSERVHEEPRAGPLPGRVGGVALKAVGDLSLRQQVSEVFSLPSRMRTMKTQHAKEVQAIAAIVAGTAQPVVAAATAPGTTAGAGAAAVAAGASS